MQINQGLQIIGKWKFSIQDTITWYIREIEQFNLIPTIWKTAFAAQMAWDNTQHIWTNLYIAVWSNTTAPNITDVQLWTEVARKAVWSTTFSWWVTSIAVFFAAWEATGTHREFGLFGSWNTTIASATVNSGIMFSHVSANVTISWSETLTCTFTITFA